MKCKVNKPARAEATAATRKDRTMAGPALLWATWPVTTYMPAPSVLPTPGEMDTDRGEIMKQICGLEIMTMIFNE